MQWYRIHRVLKEVTPPPYEPIDIGDVKRHCRVEVPTEDDLIALYVTAARQTIEARTNQTLVNTTYDLACDAFPDEEVLTLPRWPLVSVTSITSYDSADASSVFASSNYVVDPYSTPGRIFLASSSTWPSALRPYVAGVIRFTSGYGTDANTAPLPLLIAIAMLAASMFEHREEAQYVEPGAQLVALPSGVTDLISPYVVQEVG